MNPFSFDDSLSVDNFGSPRLSPCATKVAYFVVRSNRVVLAVKSTQAGCESVLSSSVEASLGRSDSNSGMCWLPDSTGLVVVNKNGGLDLVSLTGDIVGLKYVCGLASSPAVSPDGNLCAYVSDESEVHVVHLKESKGCCVVSNSNDFSFDPCFSADSKLVAWQGWNDPDMPWDSAGVFVARADGTGDPVNITEFQDRSTLQDGSEFRDRVGIDLADAHLPLRHRQSEIDVGENDFETFENQFSSIQPQFKIGGAVGSNMLGYLTDRSGWMCFECCEVSEGDGGIVVGASLSFAIEGAEFGSPSWGPGIKDWAWHTSDESTQDVRVVANVNREGFGCLALVDVLKQNMNEIASGMHSSVDSRRDTVVATRSHALEPTCLVSYRILSKGSSVEIDSSQGKLLHQAFSFSTQLKSRALQPPQKYSWTGEDGYELSGRLYIPDGIERPDFVTWIHGGPTGQFADKFMPRIAFLVSNGVGVFIPDFRGSTGWGRKHMRGLDGAWGDRDTRDIASGVASLVSTSLVSSSKSVAIGASSGGFSVYHLLAKHPELFRGGVVSSGVSDLLELARSTHRFEAHYLDTLVGDQNSTLDLYQQRSPSNFASEIRQPLLVFHGSEDPVVGVGQARNLVQQLKANGCDVEYVEYQSEGHSYRNRENLRDEIQRILEFLDKLRVKRVKK